MQFFNNLKVKYKIVVALTTIVALFVVGVIYILSRIQVINDEVEVMYKTNLLSVDYLIEADRDAYQSNLAITQLLNQREAEKPDADLVADVKDNLGQVQERFVKAEKLWEESGVQKTDDFESFHSNFEELSKDTKNLLSMISKKDFTTAEALYYGGYTEHFSTVRTAMDNLTGVFLEGAETKYQESIAISESIFSSAVLTIVVCIALSVVFAFILVLGILKPVNESKHIAERMSNGDLTVQSNIQTKDEFGVMSQSFAKMIHTLNKTITEVQQVSAQVSSGAEQLTSASSQISSGAVEQAASAEQVSASMEEMSASIQQNADNARTTESIAVKVAKDAELSGESVLRAVEAMQKISKKITIIEEIARQTNMLSLNASIEAARAGEHGKGFAVVASAVGKLAARSQEAAGDISALSQETVEVAANAREMLQRLVPEIQKTTELIQEISAASAEQSHGAEQINTAIRGLDNVIQQNSAAAEQTASTAQELSDQSKMLLKNIRFFQVDGGRSHHTNHRTDHIYREVKEVEAKADRTPSIAPEATDKNPAAADLDLEDF
ncbi:MAG: methyl-accepting chemotaxis protein [Deltaproteobacteria bacterium]|nr:methyl-accepting chemotaxis protein [Deltaproteobacteria bacterium]MBN2673496.1 methyl-accepting chemotaxis protein [Deltaproteobacteria bacterium]